MVSGEDLTDLAQTATLVVVALSLFWGIHLLRTEVKRAATALGVVLRNHKDIKDDFARLERRIDAIERRKDP